MYSRSAFSPTAIQAPLFRNDVFDSNGTTPSFGTSTSDPTLMMDGRPAPAIMIRRLPRTTSEDALMSMLIFAGDLIDTELIRSPYPEDQGFATAVARFRTQAGAIDAQQKLNGKTNTTKEANMIVELHSSGMPERRATIDGTNGRRSRFGSTFGDPSPPLIASSSSGSDLPVPESNSHFQTLFSPQSPLANGFGISGKSTINNDADDETGELLKDPVAYANGQKNKRPTQLPITRFGNLSLSTTPSPALSGMTSPRSITSPLSPTSYGMGYPRPQYPPVNPADQNPPCNTLYVGNLPIDASEDELKAIFSKQRGYKRLCFRTKQNGPMCFVEFEDVSFATKALNELYGHPLHNSVKGGIRLSFSKNPLGVRSGQTGGLPSNPVSPQAQYVNGMSPFSAVSGPPPGLMAPPGLNGMPTSPTEQRPSTEGAFSNSFGLSQYEQMSPRNLSGGLPPNMSGQFGKGPYTDFMLGR